MRIEGLNRAVTIFSNIARRPVHAVVRDRTGRHVPAVVTPLAYDRLEILTGADGALRWTVGPAESWSFSIDGVHPPIVAAGATGGVVDRPSVRVASGTTGLLVHDGRVARSRRLLQVMALCSVLLLASWVRTEGDTDEGRDRL